MLILSLDSGYAASVEEQAEFMEEVFKENYWVKFATYHVPIYEACSTGKKDAKVISDMRQYWVPLFDKHNLTAAMENHGHMFKYTKRLTGGQVDENGIRYIGDGSWGVEKDDCIYEN